ncbi:Complement-activating component of Ra-reactive factor [Anas platyrhynchos]|uniref:Complement-activating component of Ra-reactive factor n=1 Tax=Anas platyrhynchos TaxID=8839 RepID=R0JG67_ANAPL|nr:Complement-activating component of Ra-reactive factor [Anas platyrhynchos]
MVRDVEEKGDHRQTMGKGNGTLEVGAVADCKEPPELEHGFVTFSSRNNLTTYRAAIQYHCQHPYYHMAPNSTVWKAKEFPHIPASLLTALCIWSPHPELISVMGSSSTNGVAAQRASKGGHILEKGSEGRDGRAAFHCPYSGATAQLTHCSLPATYTCDASGVWRSEELGTALPSCRPGTGGDGYHGEGCGPHLPTPNFLENSPRCGVPGEPAGDLGLPGVIPVRRLNTRRVPAGMLLRGGPQNHPGPGEG